MWHVHPHRLALLELWSTGELKLRTSQAEAWRELLRLGWAHRTSRRDVIGVDEARRQEIEATLTRVFPGWRERLARLQGMGLSADERGWRELARVERASDLDPGLLPGRMNQHTASGLVAAHSKATLTAAHRETLGDAEVTRDGLVRVRANPGLSLRRAKKTADASEVTDILGELPIPERAFLDGLQFDGVLPQALLLVENLGTYIDMMSPKGWMIAHVPGWNTATLRLLLDRLPEVPVLLFGDLDPNGVAIARHVRCMRDDLLWAVPDFWAEFVASRGLDYPWPEDFVTSGLPDLVVRLAQENRWLEQEAISVDARLVPALEGLLLRRA